MLISIHAPREGCDLKQILDIHGIGKFQSTHPVRGATSQDAGEVVVLKFQSTHPVRGATRPPDLHIGHMAHFNPRTP